MSKYLIKQLKSLKHDAVNPNKEWIVSNRALLLSQITNTHTSTLVEENVWHKFSMFSRAFFGSKMFSLALRPLIILLVIGLALPTAWVATGFAAQDALPGDTLYGAKRAVEKTHLVFTSFVGDDEKEVELHAEFANRRADEVKRVVNDPVKQNEVKKTVDDLKNELELVNKKISSLKNNPNGSVMTADMARNVQKNTVEIKQNLAEIKEGLKTSTSSDTVLSDNLFLAKGLVKDTDINTVEAAVASHLNGTGSFTKEDISILVNANLLTAQQEVSSTEKGVEEIKNIVEVVKKQFANNSKRVYANSSTSTNQLNQQIIFVAEETNQAAQTSKEVSSDVERKINEAQVFLINGNFSEVVGKLKEVSNATKQVEKISDNTIQKVQSVLPVVQVIKIKESLPGNVVSSTFIVTTTVSTTINASATATTFIGTNSSTFIIIPVTFSPSKIITSTNNISTSTVPTTSVIKQVSPSSTFLK